MNHLKLSSKSKVTDLGFRVDTCALLAEIADCGLDRRMGIYFQPLNIFKSLLSRVADRAIELNDPILNIHMLSLGLYEVSACDVTDRIQEQFNRL